MTIPRWDKPLLTLKLRWECRKGVTADDNEHIETLNEALATLNAQALELRSRIAQNVASLQS